MKRKVVCLLAAAALAALLTACGAPKLTALSLPEETLELPVGETAVLQPECTYDREVSEHTETEITFTSSDETVVTVDGTGTVTGVAEGEAVVTAASGDVTAGQTVRVVIPVESIAADAVSLHTGDEALDLAYTVTPEDFSGELTFSMTDSTVAEYRDGQIVPVGEGQTELTITAPNGVNAVVPVEVWSGPRELTLNASRTEVTAGKGVQLSAADEEGNSVDLSTLTWTSSDESVAAVTGGWVDVVGTGSATITATTPHGVTDSIELTGVRPVQTTTSNSSAASGGSSASGSSASGGTSSGSTPPSGTHSDVPLGTGHGYFAVETSGTAFDLQNQLRAQVGAGALTWDDSLAAIACTRCEQIALDFSHNGAQTAENIAVGYADASSVIAAWQASPGHYANMTHAGYTRGAIAHMYDSDGCSYWVAVFA